MPSGKPALVVPLHFANLHLQMVLSGDLQPMYSAIGVGLDTGDDIATQVTHCLQLLDNLQKTGGGLADFLPSPYVTGPGFAEIGLSSTAGDVFRIEGTAEFTGTHDAEVVANNTAVLIKKVTLRAGRHGRGRMYIPGPDETGVDNKGFLSDDERGRWQNFAGVIGATIAAQTGVTGAFLFHDDFGGHDKTTAQDTTPSQIFNLLVSPQCATQRRRMRR